MAEEKPIIRPVLNDDAMIEDANIAHEVRNNKHEQRNRVAYPAGNGSCAWREWE